MRRKLAAVGGSYLIGLIFASIFFDFAIFLICGVILLVAVAIITAILTRKYDISAALLCCAAGITVFSCVSLSMAKAAEPLLNGTYDITATVAQKQVIGNDSAVFSLYTYTSDGKVGVIMYTDDIDAKKGDMLHFKARFEKLTNTAYYGTADRYRSDGITLSAIPYGDISVTKEDYPLSFIDDYREYLIGRIDDSFPDDSGALMKGIFFGDKRSFSDELYSDIRLSGSIASYRCVRYALDAYYDRTVGFADSYTARILLPCKVRDNSGAYNRLYGFFRLYGFGTEKRNNDYHGKHRRSVLPQERLS